MKSNKTEYLFIETEKLIPYVNNSRTHTEEQIKKVMASINEFGFLNPILITEDNVITAGHCRLLAAQRLGMKEVPCVKENYLTEAQRKAYVIADNKLALDAGWDEELLRLEIESLEEMDFDLTLTGFDVAELDELFNDNDKKEVEDDDFDLTKALEKASFVKRGDVWNVGKHTVMCGDATSREDIKTLMGDKRANLIITDPPYNVAFESSSGLSIKNDKMKNDDFYNFLLKSFENMASHLEEGGACYVFHADTEGVNFRKAFIDSGFHLSGCCIWVKNSLVLGRSDYHWQHEPILYGFLKNGKHRWYSDRKQTTIWNFDKPKRNENHPTSKPLKLLSYPIQNSSQENSIILDSFGGSGSTLMAAEKTDRICYTMELDEKYASVILRRYVEDTNDMDNVFVIRNGKKYYYKDLVKEVEA
ncbi:MULTISPECIES: site-specific DNA-methyltransferase [Helcococcus]|uniref:Site-specific DNA-methyltransferase n=1 Tax=Helcococcus bovis TaxID=3153252 RepID=A0ABW9F659_9FIRM